MILFVERGNFSSTLPALFSYDFKCCKLDSDFSLHAYKSLVLLLICISIGKLNI